MRKAKGQSTHLKNGFETAAHRFTLLAVTREYQIANVEIQKKFKWGK